MKPPNEGHRIEIHMNGKSKSGYWNGRTVGLFCMGKWFEWPVTSLDDARDKMREYFTTYNALLDGVAPETLALIDKEPEVETGEFLDLDDDDEEDYDYESQAHS